MTYPARTSGRWRRAGLVASGVCALAGCGRIGFSATGDGSGDAPTTDGLVVVSTSGVGGNHVVDVAFDDTSAFAVTGTYGGTLRLGSLELSSPSAQHDLFVAAFEPDGQPRWLRGGGSTDLADGQGIGWAVRSTSTTWRSALTAASASPGCSRRRPTLAQGR